MEPDGARSTVVLLGAHKPVKVHARRSWREITALGVAGLMVAAITTLLPLGTGRSSMWPAFSPTELRLCA